MKEKPSLKSFELRKQSDFFFLKETILIAHGDCNQESNGGFEIG